MTNPISQPKNRRIMVLFVLPLLSCAISSLVGIVLGQMGNIFYLVLGEAANCLAFPGEI